MLELSAVALGLLPVDDVGIRTVDGARTTIRSVSAAGSAIEASDAIPSRELSPTMSGA
jgi:hypothetical protein